MGTILQIASFQGIKPTYDLTLRILRLEDHTSTCASAEMCAMMNILCAFFPIRIRFDSQLLSAKCMLDIMNMCNFFCVVLIIQ